MTEKLPDTTVAEHVIQAWARRLAYECNADSGIAEDARITILNAADQATGCWRANTARRSLVSFAILVCPGWWVKIDTSGRLTYFDAWNGSERFVFWMNTASVRHLIDRIALDGLTDEHDQHDPR